MAILSQRELITQLSDQAQRAKRVREAVQAESAVQALAEADAVRPVITPLAPGPPLQGQRER